MKVCIKMESSAPSYCEVWTVNKFLNAEGVTKSEIHRRLSYVYDAGNVTFLHHAYKWIEHFNTGWSDMHNEKWIGHLWDSINDETIACVRTLLMEDCQFTISDIHREITDCYRMQTSRTIVFHILTEELEMRNGIAWWVPCMLTENNCWNHIGAG